MFFRSSADEAQVSSQMMLLCKQRFVFRTLEGTLPLRSEPKFLFILFSLPAFSSYDFMNSVDITSDQGFFLCTAPTFDLMLPLKGIHIGFSDCTPNKFYRTATECVRCGVCTSLMLVNASIQIFCQPGVIGAICAAKNVNCIRHNSFYDSPRFVFAMLRSARCFCCLALSEASHRQALSKDKFDINY